ncbi:AT-rich interactive domain-containing protein 4B-like [Anolis sagrei]|uniref:AT-rich interactive domain-containing protein 4B-like n=1 Tax=Anolis sagrei TaxID=38937 RepID=UPI003522F220
MHCRGHQCDKDPVTYGNRYADTTAKAMARKGGGKELVMAPLQYHETQNEDYGSGFDHIPGSWLNKSDRQKIEEHCENANVYGTFFKNSELFDKDNETQSKEKAEEKQTLDLTVETGESSKYPRTLCETKIQTPGRLVGVKITSRHDSFTIKVPEDRTRKVLKIGTVVEVKDLSETYQKVVINNLTDASLYTTTIFDEDKKTLKHSTLCLKEERHFAESKTVDQLFLTNLEHFDMSTSEKKVSRKRRSNHISEEKSPLSFSKEERENKSQADGLSREIIYTDYVNGDKRERLQLSALEVHPDYSGKIAIKKDSVLDRSSKDSEFSSVPRRDVRGIPDSSLQPDAAWRQAFVQASKFYGSRTIPDNWKTRLKEETPTTTLNDIVKISGAFILVLWHNGKVLSFNLGH